MRTPLDRIRLGAFLLAAVIVLAVFGYRACGYDWLESLWMVVITISSVGYGERSQSAPAVQMLTIGLILVGMSAAAYTLGGFMQMLLEGELDQWLGHRRMTREIEQLNDHVIICGFGRIGQVLSHDLRRQHKAFVVIEQDPTRAEEARRCHHLCILGDATEEQVLLSARLAHSRALFTGLPNDAANVFITLTARNLNPSVQIIARAEHPSTEKKLRQAGANRIVMPTLIGAHHVERMITRPSTADLMELVAESSFTDLELDEVTVVEGAKLVGVSVEQTEAHRKHRLLVVAVKQGQGKMIFNPDAKYQFQPGDVLMVMGHEADIRRFRSEFVLN